MQTRRTILKSLAAGGALLGTPVLRSAFAAEDADVVLRLVAGPAMNRLLCERVEAARARDPIRVEDVELAPSPTGQAS